MKSKSKIIFIMAVLIVFFLLLGSGAIFVSSVEETTKTVGGWDNQGLRGGMEIGKDGQLITLDNVEVTHMEFWLRRIDDNNDLTGTVYFEVWNMNNTVLASASMDVKQIQINVMSGSGQFWTGRWYGLDINNSQRINGTVRLVARFEKTSGDGEVETTISCSNLQDTEQMCWYDSNGWQTTSEWDMWYKLTTKPYVEIIQEPSPPPQAPITPTPPKIPLPPGPHPEYAYIAFALTGILIIALIFMRRKKA